MAGNQLAQRSWLLTVADMAMIWLRTGQEENELEVVAKAAVNNMASGVIILDAQNIVLDLNRQARQIIDSVSLNREPHPFVGKTARNALGVWPNLVAFLYSSNKEYQALLKCDVGGELRYYDVHIEPVYSEYTSDGRPCRTNKPELLVGRYIVLHDNTERERASQALQERKKQLRSMVDQLRKADRYQVALADSIQQELKEPLDKLSTIIDSLDQGAVPEQLAQDMDRLKHEALALQKIVDEMDVFSHHRRPPSFYAEPASKNAVAHTKTESLRTESFH